MWKLGPRVQISLDSRYEVAYPDWRLEEDHVFFEAREGWQAILTKYSTDIVLVPNRLLVASKLNEIDGWRRVYRESQFAMFARDGVELETFETAADPPEGTFP